MGTLPTVADLRARRLELTRVALHERLLAGELDDVRVIVETLAQEFEMADVAAAAVKLLHAASGDSDEREIPSALPAPQPPGSFARPRGPRGVVGGSRDASGARRPHRESSEALTRIFVGVGRQAGVAPRDLVGAITAEAGVPFGDIGAIDIADRFALVEVPERLADTIISALRATTIRGRKALVRRERADVARR